MFKFKQVAIGVVAAVLVFAPLAEVMAKDGGPGASSGGGNSGGNGNGGAASGGVGGVGSGGVGGGVGGGDGSAGGSGGPGGGSGGPGGGAGGPGGGAGGPGGGAGGPGGGAGGGTAGGGSGAGAASGGAGAAGGAGDGGNGGGGAIAATVGHNSPSVNVYKAWAVCAGPYDNLMMVRGDGSFSFDATTGTEAMALKQCLVSQGMTFKTSSVGPLTNFGTRPAETVTVESQQIFSSK